jgi:hypothetical protein
MHLVDLPMRSYYNSFVSQIQYKDGSREGGWWGEWAYASGVAAARADNSGQAERGWKREGCVS